MTNPRRNIEAKYRCPDLAVARRRAQELGAEERGLLRQTDRFFAAARGRLKVREFGDGTAELIGYLRSDMAEARGSDYLVYPTTRAAELTAVLAHALGAHGLVRKTRVLFVWRSTRIHLDEVEGLGSFVELETVISGQSDDHARAELGEVAAALALRAEDIVPEAYVDLLGRPPPAV